MRKEGCLRKGKLSSKSRNTHNHSYNKEFPGGRCYGGGHGTRCYYWSSAHSKGSHKNLKQMRSKTILEYELSLTARHRYVRSDYLKIEGILRKPQAVIVAFIKF